jgi:hypothetical protein
MFIAAEIAAGRTWVSARIDQTSVVPTFHYNEQYARAAAQEIAQAGGKAIVLQTVALAEPAPNVAWTQLRPTPPSQTAPPEPRVR